MGSLIASSQSVSPIAIIDMSININMPIQGRWVVKLCQNVLLVFLVFKIAIPLFLQVYIGPYRNRQVEVHTVRDLSGIKVGQLVAIHCQEGTEPAIAKITVMDEDSVHVIWLKGEYSTAWAPYILYEGRKKVERVDKLPKSSIILYGFELTKHCHLHNN